MKHFRNKQKCECKPYFLEKSKALFIENNNFTQVRKGYKKREICLYPFFSLFLFSFTLFGDPLWSGQVFINLLSKAMIVCSRISMQSLSMKCFLNWKRPFVSSFNWRLSGTQKKSYEHSIGIFTMGQQLVGSQLSETTAVTNRLMLLPAVWLAQRGA